MYLRTSNSVYGKLDRFFAETLIAFCNLPKLIYIYIILYYVILYYIICIIIVYRGVTPPPPIY